ncbi:MAG: HNH endonuclease [Candidatus Helarchaeota archaeon]
MNNGKIEDKNKEYFRQLKTLLQYGISEVDATALLEHKYNKTKFLKAPQNILLKYFKEEKIQEWKNKLKRKKIPDKIIDDLLIKSDSQCILCEYGIRNPIIIHHIIPYHETQDNSFENLIILCLNHHAEVHTKYIISQTPYTPQFLKNTRNNRYHLIETHYTKLGLEKIEEMDKLPVREPGILFGNLIPIEIKSKYIWFAQCKYSTKKNFYENVEDRKITFPPFIIRENKLFTLINLKENNIFDDYIQIETFDCLKWTEWLNDSSKNNYLIALINSCIKWHCNSMRLKFLNKSKKVFIPNIFFGFPNLQTNYDRRKVKWRKHSKGKTIIRVYSTREDNRILNFLHIAAKIKVVLLNKNLFILILPTWIFTEDGWRVISGARARELDKHMRESRSNYNNPQHNNFKFWKWYLFESPFSRLRPLSRKIRGKFFHLLSFIKVKDALQLNIDWRPRSRPEIATGKTIKSQKTIEEFI